MSYSPIEASALRRAPSGAAPGAVIEPGCRIVVMSGQVAWDEDGGIPDPGDIRAQARVAYEKVAHILAEAGAGVEHIVKLNVYLTDRSHREAAREARRACLGEHNPPSTTVVVSSLVDDGLLIEVDAIAAVPVEET
jgi:enamine deaminase RidA (YjgF/YER057c/UK114 family)